jgi:hypothetical protein
MRHAVLLAMLLLVAGCGGSTTSTAPTQAAGSTTTEACPPTAGAGTGPQSSPANPSQTMLLTAVKVDSDTCADRAIFDFRPDGAEKPGFRVEYRPADEAQTEDASGRHIPVAGRAFLVVRFEPAATADLSGAQLERTYTGPRRVRPAGKRFLRELVKTGDFEAVLTWTIGLSERRPFTVTSSGSPPRLTIEIG